jgi:LmbE family N-acetylglucosaminyl deacetylase
MIAVVPNKTVPNKTTIKTATLLDAFDWNRFERVLVLSPHLDDAALSCGALLSMLRGLVSRLVVTINCANPSEQKSGRRRQGHASPQERRHADIAAMHAMDCDFVHLGFADCIYRRSPITGKLIYRDSRSHWQHPGVDDAAHIEELFLVLRRLCLNMGRFLLISPLGIGLHVDHTICAQLALRLTGRKTPLLFYEDFPYVVDPDVGGRADDGPELAAERLGLRLARRFVVPYATPVKTRFLSHYRSEIPLLFGDEARMRSMLALPRYEGQPSEIFWECRPSAEGKDR